MFKSFMLDALLAIFIAVVLVGGAYFVSDFEVVVVNKTPHANAQTQSGPVKVFEDTSPLGARIYRYDTTDGMSCYSFSNGSTYTLSCVKK